MPLRELHAERKTNLAHVVKSVVPVHALPADYQRGLDASAG